MISVDWTGIFIPRSGYRPIILDPTGQLPIIQPGASSLAFLTVHSKQGPMINEFAFYGRIGPDWEKPAGCLKQSLHSKDRLSEVCYKYQIERRWPEHWLNSGINELFGQQCKDQMMFLK